MPEDSSVMSRVSRLDDDEEEERRDDEERKQNEHMKEQERNVCDTRDDNNIVKDEIMKTSEVVDAVIDVKETKVNDITDDAVVNVDVESSPTKAIGIEPSKPETKK